VAAGPIANFLLAILVFALTFTFVGVNVTAPRVDELVADGAAARAGFKTGDVIVGIDGQPVDEPEDVSDAVSAHRPGDEIEVEVMRDGKRRTITIELAKRPQRTP
jgi:regulator of sigma E protease